MWSAMTTGSSAGRSFHRSNCQAARVAPPMKPPRVSRIDVCPEPTAKRVPEAQAPPSCMPTAKTNEPISSPTPRGPAEGAGDGAEQSGARADDQGEQRRRGAEQEGVGPQTGAVADGDQLPPGGGEAEAGVEQGDAQAEAEQQQDAGLGPVGGPHIGGQCRGEQPGHHEGAAAHRRRGRCRAAVGRRWVTGTAARRSSPPGETGRWSQVDSERYESGWGTTRAGGRVGGRRGPAAACGGGTGRYGSAATEAVVDAPRRVRHQGEAEQAGGCGHGSRI